MHGEEKKNLFILCVMQTDPHLGQRDEVFRNRHHPAQGEIFVFAACMLI